MFIKQISVFLENHNGALRELTELLGKDGVDLLALSVADTQNFGIIRIIVSSEQTDAALLTVDKIMGKFPDVTPFGYSDNFTYCRFLVMLACAQRVPGRDYSKAINHVLDFFARHARPCGGIEEAPIRLLDDDEASVGFGDKTLSQEDVDAL